MNEALRHFFLASLRRVRFASSHAGTDQIAAAPPGGDAQDVAQARAAAQVTPSRAPPMQDVLTVLERVNYRLDAIEEKIDLLLVPIEMTRN